MWPDHFRESPSFNPNTPFIVVGELDGQQIVTAKRGYLSALYLKSALLDAGFDIVFIGFSHR